MTFGDLHVGAPIFYVWGRREDQNIDARRKTRQNNIDYYIVYDISAINCS